VTVPHDIHRVRQYVDNRNGDCPRGFHRLLTLAMFARASTEVSTNPVCTSLLPSDILLWTKVPYGERIPEDIP